MCRFSLVIYCSIRFAVTDTRRAALVGGKDWTFYLTLVLNWIYVFSSLGASLIFVVTPNVDVIAHTALFIVLMQGRWLCVAGQFVEAYVRPQGRIKRASGYISLSTLRLLSRPAPSRSSP